STISVVAWAAGAGWMTGRESETMMHIYRYRPGSGRSAGRGRKGRGISSTGAPFPHGEVLLPAAAQPLPVRQRPQLAELADEGLAHRPGGALPVGVRAAGRLGDDLVDHRQVH